MFLGYDAVKVSEQGETTRDLSKEPGSAGRG